MYVSASLYSIDHLFRVEPNVIGCTVLDEEKVACVESEAYVTSTIKMRDVVYDAELLGQK